jgi:hypothetical protein
MSDEIKRNQAFDRNTFIDDLAAAFSKGTWFVVTEDGEGFVEEPMAESIKAAGKIPQAEGYALGESSYLYYCFPCLFTTWMITELDYTLEPCTVIAALAKNNITTVESVLRACHFLYKFMTLNLITLYSQFPSETLAEMVETMNAADNVSIGPIYVIEEVGRVMFYLFSILIFFAFQKRRLTEMAHKEEAQNKSKKKKSRPNV